jgi:hypothetical protein
MSMSPRKKSKLSAAQWAMLGVIGAALVAGIATVTSAIIQKSSTSTPSPISCQIEASEISVAKTIVKIGEAIKVSVFASNPDGKAMLYNWQATSGSMNPGLRSPTSESIYTPPSYGTEDTISVVITMAGCEIRRSMQISVIESVDISPLPTVSPTLGLNTVIVEKPILSSPSNGISMPQKTDITLVWNPSKGAVQYEVEAWGGPYTIMTPCIWQDATICHIGQMAPGTISWRVKARNDKGQASEWSDTWSFKIEMIPGYVELLDDLRLTTPAGDWPPKKGDKLIAHIHIRNGGDQPLQIVHIGVKGRRNGNEFWDIGFWSITLNGNEPWSFDPNNERPLESGEYSFQLTYSLDGTTWELLGSEYKFTIP